MHKFLLPILAVVLGVIIALLSKNKKTWNTKLLLSFSGAFLLALTLFELLPEVYNHLEAKSTGLFIMCGILLQIILELFQMEIFFIYNFNIPVLFRDPCQNLQPLFQTVNDNSLKLSFD